jgi:hypothetical protein
VVIPMMPAPTTAIFMNLKREFKIKTALRPYKISAECY